MIRVRCQGYQCETTYDLTLDRLGRLVGDCPTCARRQAGQCATCEQPVEGTPKLAKYCGPCKVLAHRRHHQRYRLQDVEAYNRRAAARIARKRAIQRMGRPVMDQKTIGTLRGLARAKALSPERRREIAAKASRTRWQKYYQREMLRKMREAS